MPDPRPLPKISKVEAPAQGHTLSMLTGQFGQSKYDVGESPYQQQNKMTNRAEQQSNWRAFANSLQQSVVGEVIGGALQSAGSIVDAISGKGYDDPGTLFQWGKDLQEGTRERAPIYVDPNRNNMGNMEWWLQGLPSLASSAAMLIPGMGVAKGVGAVGKAMRASQFATNLAERGMGALAMRHAENQMEAYQNRQQVYDDLLNRGYDADKATVAADYAGSLTYKMNYGNLLFDFIQLSAIMKPVKGVSFAQGKNLGVIDRMKAVNEAGYRVADRAVKDFGSKGILDGLKWWEKSLVYGTRYASPIIAQGSEGIEEVINNFSQQEGAYQADRIAKGQGADAPIWEGGDKDFMKRAKDSALSKSGKESFFWGVMGGVAFNKVGQLMNMAMDPEHRSQQSIQIANLDNRKNMITNALKVMADPESTASEKREAQFSLVFDLSRQSVMSGNDEVLVEALQSKEYRDILKAETGITDETLFQKKIDEIAEDVRYIQDSYSKYVGKDMKALNQRAELANMNMFGVENAEPALGEKPEIKELATPDYFNWTSNSRQATDYLVQLDYFAHKNDQLNKESNFELEKLVNETFGDLSMGQKNAAKAYYRKIGVDKNIINEKAKLTQAKKAKNSKGKIEQLEAGIKSLKDISDRYEKIYKEQLQAMREEAATQLYGEGDYADKTEGEKELSAAIAESDFIVKRDSIADDAGRMNFNIVGRNIDKQIYAQERAKAVADPIAWHAEFTANNAGIEAFLEEEKRLAEEFGINPDDTQEVRDFKIEMGKLAKSDDPESESVKSYRNNYGNYSQYTTEEQFKLTADVIKAELAKFDFSKPDTFDKTGFLKLKGQQQALAQAKIEFDKKKAEAAAAAATSAAPVAPGQPGKPITPITTIATGATTTIPTTHPHIVELSKLNDYAMAVFATTLPTRAPINPETDFRADGYINEIKLDYNILQKFKLAHPEYYKNIQRLLEIANKHGVVDSTGEPVSMTTFKLNPDTIGVVLDSQGRSRRDVAGAILTMFQPILDHIEELQANGTLSQNPDMMEFNDLIAKSFTGLTDKDFAGKYGSMPEALESLTQLNSFDPNEILEQYISPEIKEEIERAYRGITLNNYEDFFLNQNKVLDELVIIYKQLSTTTEEELEETEERTDAALLTKQSQLVDREVEPLNNINLQEADNLAQLSTEQIIQESADHGSTQLEKVTNDGKIVIQDGTQIRVDTPFSIFSKIARLTPKDRIGSPVEWTDEIFKVPILYDGVGNYNYDKWAHVGSPYYLKPNDDIKLVRTGATRTKPLKSEPGQPKKFSEPYDVVEIYKVDSSGTEIYLGNLPYMSETEYQERGWEIKDMATRKDVRDVYVNIRKLFPESGVLHAKASPMKIGNLIFNHATVVDKGNKKTLVYDYGRIGESFQLEHINQEYDKTKSQVYFTVMRGVGADNASLEVRSNTRYVPFEETDNGQNIHILVRPEYNKQKYVGQTFALVPTNTIHNGKHVYYAVLMSGRNIGDFNPVEGAHKGKNIVEAIIDVVLNPRDNDALIRELATKIGGVSFNPGKPVIEQRKALISFYELVPSIIARLAYVNLQPSEGGSAQNYVYPFRFTYLNPETIKRLKEKEEGKEMKAKMEKGAIDNLYGSFVMEIGNNEKAFQTIGEPTSERWLYVAKQAKPILDNKPLRIDNRYVSHNINSGAYSIPFFNDKGELTIQEFPSYLHYLNDKRAIASIIQGVDISGKRFYFTPGTPYFRGVSEGTAQNYSPQPAVVKIKPDEENPINNLFGEKPTMEESIKAAAKQGQEEKKEEIALTTPVPIVETPAPVVPITEEKPTAESKPINIWAGSGENSQFSNFAVRPFSEEGDISNMYESDTGKKLVFKTVEGAFQAYKIFYADGSYYDKTGNKELTDETRKLLERFANATGPQAKAMGRQIKGLDRVMWEEQSSGIMKDLIFDSFQQNPDAAKALIDTGNATITHTQDNTKWRTEFPRILMEVRNELAAAPSQTKPAEVVADVISEADYKKFIDYGVVSEALLKTIADKVKNQQQLSPRELEIFTDKTSYINKILAAEQEQLVKELMAEKEEIEKAIAEDKKRKEAEKPIAAAMEDLTTEEKDTVALVYDQNKKPDESLESFIATAVVNEQNNRAPYKGDKGIIAKFREILRKIMKTFLLIGAISSLYIGSSSLVVPNNVKISPPTGFHIDLSSPGSIQTTIGEYHQSVYKNTPYSILDKKTREMYVYDSSGVMIYKGPALMGSTEGKDTLTMGTMKEFYEFVEKVTPSGEFRLDRVEDSSYGAKYSFFLTDPNGKKVKPSPHFAVAFHSTSQLPDRLAALATADPADNAISFGCVAVGKSDFTQLEGKMGEGSHIYILPDNSNRALYESFLKERYSNPRLTFKQFLENITKPAEKVPGKQNLPLEASMLAGLLAVIRKRRGEGVPFTDDDISELEKRLKEINDQLAAQPKTSEETLDKNSFYKTMGESIAREPQLSDLHPDEIEEMKEDSEELPFDPSKMFRKPDETDMVPLSSKATTVERFMDPYIFRHQPSTYNKLASVATDILMEVLQDQRGDKLRLKKPVLKRLGRDKLLNLISRNKTYMAEHMTDWKNSPDSDKRLRYTEAETALENLKYLASTFDSEFMPPSVKKLTGKFEGYFNLAYDRLFASKIVNFSQYVDDVVIDDDSYVKRVRHDDNWSAYINPKDTVLFRAKIFLSRIPKYKANGDVEYNEFGLPVYHSLDQIYNNIYSEPDKTRPRNLSKYLMDDDQTNPVLRAIGITLDKYKITHPELYGPMFNMMASALLLQRRDMWVTSAKTSEDGGLDVSIFNLNRQQIEEQVLNKWDENFKVLLPHFYDIKQEMKGGVVSTEVNDLKEKELSIYTNVTKPAVVDFSYFADPKSFLETLFDSGEITASEFEERRADYKMEFILQYFLELKNMMETLKSTVQLRIPDKVDLGDGVEVTKEELATLLRYLNVPPNIQLDKYTASVVKPTTGEGAANYKTKLGSIVQSMEDVLKTPTVHAVSPQALHLFGYLMDHLGVSPNQDFKKSGQTIYNLSKNFKALRSIDYKHASDIAYILKSKVVNGIGKRLITPDVLPDGKTTFKWLADALEYPFGRDRIAMRDLAKGLKTYYPNLVSNTVVNNDGENEYSVNFPTALSNMVARLRYDPIYRESILSNPMIKNNKYLTNMLTGDLNEFALQYNAGFKMGLKSYNVKSINEYVYPAMAFTFFQNGEKSGKSGTRSVGRFLTQHGESHVTPAFRSRKLEIDINFRKSENGKISVVTRSEDAESPLFNSAAGIFKNELNRVYLTQRIFEATQRTLDHLIKTNPTASKADLVREAALISTKSYNAQEGYNFHIKGDKLVPGAGMRFTLFGEQMFNDTKKVIYNEQGLLKEEFISEGLADAKVAVDKILKSYLDDFLTSMVDQFIENNKNIGLYKPRETADIVDPADKNLDYVYPLFDEKYVEHMRALLRGRVYASTKRSGESLLTIEEWNGKDKKTSSLGQVLYSYNSNDSEEDQTASKARADEYLQYEYRYLAADFLFNYFVFKSSYFQLFQDPATFQKTETYKAVKVESDKRLKHHLGPGSMTGLRPDRKDDIRVVHKMDTYVHDMKMPVTEMEVSKMQPHEKKALKYMMDTFGKDGYFHQKGNIYYIPTDFESLASTWFVHKDSKDLESVLRAYLTQRVDDGGAEITPREFLSRHVITGEISQEEAIEYLKVLENEDSTPADFEKLRKDMPITVMKMIYSNQNELDVKDPETGKIHKILTFNVLKNSESVMTPALVKGTEKAKVYQDLIKVERNILAAEGLGRDSFAFGIIHAPISNSKSSHPTALKMWNPDGSYNGSVIKSYVQRLDREGLREQQDSVLKEDTKITQSSQASSFGMLNVPSDMYFGPALGHTKLKEDQLKSEDGLSAEEFINARIGLTNVQVDNIRTGIYGAQIRQDWMDIIAELGLAQNSAKRRSGDTKQERFMNGLYIRDAKKFLRIIGEQMRRQFGVSEDVFPYLETVIEKDAVMRIPISETAFGKMAENVIMAKLSRIVSGRKTEGIPLIQATSDGYHVYDKAAGQIKKDSNLRGYRIETKVLEDRFISPQAAKAAFPYNYYDVEIVEESNGSRSYKPIIYNVIPAEIDVSWNFRGPDGKLLKYEDYVNDDGTPKLGKNSKWTDDMLEVIGYRVPNTGANTIAYLKIRRFLPPSHVDIVRVPPMLLTMMNADLDVDKLYLYTKTYEVKDGKIQHIPSVLHDTQENATSIIYTEENKRAFVERYLNAYNQEYRALSEEIAALSRDAAIIKEAVSKLGENYNELKDQLDIVREEATRTREGDPEIESFMALLKEKKSLKRLISLSNRAISGDEYILQQMMEQLPEEYPDGMDSEDDVRRFKRNLKSDLIKFTIPKLAEIEEKVGKLTKKKEVLQAIEDPRYKGLLESVDTKELDEKMEKLERLYNSKYKTFSFNKKGLAKHGFSFYDIMSPEQLQNSMLDTFKIMFSSGSMLKKMTTPLNSNAIMDLATEKSVVYYNDKGEVVKTSLSERNPISMGSINDQGAAMQFKQYGKDNSDMISIMAALMRSVSISQRGAFYLVGDERIPDGLLYGEVERNKDGVYETRKVDGTAILHNEPPVTANNSFYVKDAVTYYNTNEVYNKRMRHVDNGHWRFDAFHGKDMHGNEYEVSGIAASALQAALDGVKELVNGYLNLNPETVNAFMVHVMLRHKDEGARIINTEIIKRYSREVLANRPDATEGKSARMKRFVSELALSSGIISEAGLEAILSEYKKLDALGLASKILYVTKHGKDRKTLSVADLNRHIGEDVGDITVRKDDKTHAQREFMILYNFIVADDIGNQLLTVNQNLNTFNKGTENNIISVLDKKEKYQDMHRLTRNKTVQGKWDFSTSVPNIGGIYRIDEQFAKTTKGQKGMGQVNLVEALAHHTASLFVDNTFGSDENIVFLQGTQMMRKIQTRVMSMMPLQYRDVAMKRKLHIEFTAFMNSNPELYQQLFTEEAEFEFFKEHGMAQMLKRAWVSDTARETISFNNDVFLDKDLSMADMLEGLKEKYGSTFDVLNALKVRRGQGGNPDTVIYMNIANLGDRVALTYSNNLSMMYDYEAPENATELEIHEAKFIRALARQLILHTMNTHGGINTPNSLSRHLSASLHYGYGFDVVKRGMIERLKKDDKFRNSIADTFGMQFLQHYNNYAFQYGEGLLSKAVVDPKSGAARNIVRFNEKEDRHEIHLRQFAVDEFKRLKLINFQGRMFRYQYEDNLHKLVESDKLGNRQFNTKEYKWNDTRQVGTSLINGNISTVSKKFIDPGETEDAKERPLLSYAQELKDFLSQDTSDFNSVLELYNTGHYTSKTLSLSEMLMDEYINLLGYGGGTVDFNPTVTMINDPTDNRRAYIEEDNTGSANTYRIYFNKAHFIKDGVVLTSEFDETLGHETTHLFNREALKETIGRQAGDSVNPVILNEVSRQSLVDKVNDLAKIYMLVKKAANTPGNAFNDMNRKYKDAKLKGDTVEMERLRAMRIFEIEADIDGYINEKPGIMKDWSKLTFVYQALADYISYARSNEAFQRALNNTKLSELDAAMAEKEGDKSIWEWIKDFITDIIDGLLNLKDLKKMTPLEIQHRSLLHVSLSAIHEIFNPAARLALEKRMTIIRANPRSAATEEGQEKPQLVIQTIPEKVNRSKAGENEDILYIVSTTPSDFNTSYKADNVINLDVFPEVGLEYRYDSTEEMDAFRSRVTKSVAAIKKKMEKGGYKAVLMSSLFGFGDSPNVMKFKSLRDEYKQIVSDEIKKAGIAVTFNPGDDTDMVPALFDEVYKGVKNYSELWSGELKNIYNNLVIDSKIIC